MFHHQRNQFCIPSWIGSAWGQVLPFSASCTDLTHAILLWMKCIEIAVVLYEMGWSLSPGGEDMDGQRGNEMMRA